MYKHLLLASSLLAATQALACPIPPLNGSPVADAASVLSLDQEAKLVGTLTEINRAGGHQVAVATIPSLQGSSVEECANAIFRQWGLGSAKQDDGVLILLAKQERKLRIEVGYGLEGDLTDAQVARINRTAIVPKLKQGDFSGGLTAGALAVGQAINVPPPAAPQALLSAPEKSESKGWAVLGFMLGACALLVGVGAVIVGQDRKRQREKEAALERARQQRLDDERHRKKLRDLMASASPPPSPPPPAAKRPVKSAPAPSPAPAPSQKKSSSSSSSSSYSGYDSSSRSSSYDSGSSWGSSSSSSYDSGSSFSGGGGDSGGGGGSSDW